MFNFFKKTTNEAAASTEKQSVVCAYPEVVQEIHNEFFTAGDRILEQANKILQEADSLSIEKGKRLAAIGFGNVPEAKKAIETERVLVSSKEQAHLVQHYRVNYPNNKFITEDQVKAICEKYGLVCGDVSMYKGFVPESKLKQIESFRVSEKDFPFAKAVDSWNSGELIDYVGKDDIIDKWAIKQIEEGSHFYIIAGSIVNDYIKNPEKYRFLGKGLGTKQDERYIACMPFDKGFKICAPLKDMEVPVGKRVEGYKIEDIPDPVVLQPVKGGYLIVCAWGDEASDEIVVNQAMN